MKRNLKSVAKLPIGDYNIDQGEFIILTEEVIVYKSAYISYTNLYKYRRCTIKLALPVGTEVYVTNHKCRADQAKVIKINLIGKKETHKSALSIWDYSFKYVVNNVVTPSKKFSLNQHDCASGIHFFRTLREARDYNK